MHHISSKSISASKPSTSERFVEKHDSLSKLRCNRVRKFMSLALCKFQSDHTAITEPLKSNRTLVTKSPQVWWLHCDPSQIGEDYSTRKINWRFLSEINDLQQCFLCTTSYAHNGIHNLFIKVHPCLLEDCSRNLFGTGYRTDSLEESFWREWTQKDSSRKVSSKNLWIFTEDLLHRLPGGRISF